MDYSAIVICVLVALGLGLGGISWGPTIFIATVVLSYLAMLWRSDPSSMAASGFILPAFAPILSSVAIAVASLALGESFTRSSATLAAFVASPFLFFYLYMTYAMYFPLRSSSSLNLAKDKSPKNQTADT